MFAHQVIDFLISAPEEFHYLIPKIRSAQKFHVEDAISILDICKIENVVPFKGDLLENIALPYKTIWLDYIYNPGLMKLKEGQIAVRKRGILASEIDKDVMQIYLFFYYNRWILSPIRYEIGLKIHHVKKYGARSAELDDKAFRIIDSENAYDLGVLNAFRIIDSENAYDLGVLNAFLMLINCKNITTTSQQPNIILNKKRVKSLRCPLFTYKILILKPRGKKQKSIPKHLWDNRIHLCRGHFKTYTKENPLFGIITGRFWWQPQARGNSKKGIVVKDYVIRGEQV